MGLEDWLPTRVRGLFYGPPGQMTWSGRRLARRIVAGAGALVMLVTALAAIAGADWRGVLGGAFLAWSVSILVWAASTYRVGRSDMEAEIRRVAEVDVLHDRLNAIASRVGAPELDIDFELEHALQERAERLAHFASLDEFRPDRHDDSEASADDEANESRDATSG